MLEGVSECSSIHILRRCSVGGGKCSKLPKHVAASFVNIFLKSRLDLIVRQKCHIARMRDC